MALMTTLRRLVGLKGPVEEAVDHAADTVAALDQETDDERATREEYGRIARWDGHSLRDLPMELIKFDPDSAREEALVNTVPEGYRGTVMGGPRSEGWTGATENSEWRTYVLAEILAIDKSGEALVNRSDYNEYLDAESYRISTMRQEKAFSIIDGLRAETAEATPAQTVPSTDMPVQMGKEARMPSIEQADKTKSVALNHTVHAAVSASMFGR